MYGRRLLPYLFSAYLGYVIGGRLADRCSTNRALGYMILFSGVLYLLLPVIARPFLDAAGASLRHCHGRTNCRYDPVFPAIDSAGLHFTDAGEISIR